MKYKKSCQILTLLTALFIFHFFLFSCSRKIHIDPNYKPSIDFLVPHQFPTDYFNLVPLETYSINSDKVPILMYHSIDNPKHWISAQTFRDHLEMLYQAGFSTIKLDDYLHNNFGSIPEGRRPIIFTFDDQWGSQFHYENATGTKISKNSAVGILEEFSKKHPLFGKNAVFYLIFSRLPFLSYEDHLLWKKKLLYLINSGFELGSHTYDHSIMTKMQPNKLKEELDFFYQRLFPIIGKKTSQTMTLAYPGGNVPINIHVIKNYTFQGFPLKAAFIAGGGYAKVPVSKNITLFELPRIEGSTQNIKWIINQPTFVVHKKVVSIPKIFTSSRELVVQWMNRKSKNDNFFLKELNL